MKAHELCKELKAMDSTDPVVIFLQKVVLAEGFDLELHPDEEKLYRDWFGYSEIPIEGETHERTIHQ